MSKHARLAASQSHRWMVCPASIHLIESFHDIVSPTSSIYAEEGTHAHDLLSQQLNAIYHNAKPAPSLEKDQWALDTVLDYVMEQIEFKSYNPINEPKLLVDKYVKPFDHRDDMGGTGDIIILSDSEVEIIDYKHGRGVYVPVKDNTQLIIYALGVLNAIGIDFYDPNYTMYEGYRIERQLQRDKSGNVWLEDVEIPIPLKVKITIIQPRHGQAREASPRGDGIMSHTYSLIEMKEWGGKILDAIDKVDKIDKKFVKATYTMHDAYEDGFISPGDPKLKRTGKDPCRFCDIKTMCPATHDIAQSAKRAAADFADIDGELDLSDSSSAFLKSLEPEEVELMMDTLVKFYEDAQTLKTIASASEEMMKKALGNTLLEDYLLERGYSLANKTGNRTWMKEDKLIVARMLHEFGLTKMQCYDVKLNSPAKMEKHLNASQKRALKETDLFDNPVTGQQVVYKGE